MPQPKQPRLILHGGAGTLEGNVPDMNSTGSEADRLRAFHIALEEISKEAYEVLLDQTAEAAVLCAVGLLEDNPLFNAGTGAKLQADGIARLSAGLMDGGNNRFSGVVNVQQVRHPIELAQQLGNQKHKVLAGEPATLFARNLGIPEHDPITPERLTEHKQRIQGKSGTVGAVALDRNGSLFAGTSTGGIGGETPGRMSDCATVAGTYASSMAGVSCTGIGEEIVNTAAAAKIVTRVEDGLALEKAVNKTIDEADQRDYRFGLIALDGSGHWQVGCTHNTTVLYAIHDGQTIRTFLGDNN